MDINLLVSYDPHGGYLVGKTEANAILEKLGDKKSKQELLIPGIIGIETELRPRDVIEDARELFMNSPERFNYTLKWVPIDHWCDNTVDSIIKTVKHEVVQYIADHEKYAIDVVTHRSELHKEPIIEAVAPLIKGKVDLDYPQKIIRIELFDKKASVTLLQQKNIFSVMKN